MKTFASRLAALLLAATSFPACAATVFDNLAAAVETYRFTDSTQYYTQLQLANRIPVGPDAMRIDTVTMDIDEFNGLEVKVCDTSASATAPDASRCAPFTPDQTSPGRRVFSGSGDISPGNVAWVVMRSTGWSKVRFQIITGGQNGLAWNTQGNNYNTWITGASTYGMAVTGASIRIDGACGSASGTTPYRFPPDANLCSAGTPGMMFGEPDRFTWSCQGANGGSDALSCSAPRSHFVYTQATGGGSIEPGREVVAGQRASFTLSPQPGYAAAASGCGGTLSDNVFTTGVIDGVCTVSATFTPTATHGACGDTAPTPTRPAHLCSAGNAINLGDTLSDFNWQCAGTNGGSTATCQARRQHQVTVTQDIGIRTAQCSPNPVTYNTATTCTATAYNPTGRPFSGWTGACSGMGPCTPTVLGPTSVSAHSAFVTHTITTSATNGTVTCTPNPIEDGRTATCTATPDAGYQFNAWSGDCTGSGTCTLLYVDGPRSVSATFSPQAHAIATPAATGGSVACTPNPVPHGQDASCTATSATGYQFTAWTGDCTGSGTCSLNNVTGPRSVSATFTLNTYAIATPAATGGSVTCTPNPAPHGQDASCTATSATGYQFTAWTGDCTGGSACSLNNVTGPRSVSATFTLNTYAIATPAATGGSVACTPNPVPHGQDASCTATPAAGYQFSAWSGDCTGGGTCSLNNVTGPRSVSASFTLHTYAIATPAATGGSVACTPNPVPHGQDATCTATPDTRYQFSAWSGDCSGAGECQLTHVTRAHSVGAQFTLQPVDGACGVAAGRPAITAPGADLCAAGAPGGMQSANGQYAWSCAGEHGGAAQQCSAPWADAGQGTGTVELVGGSGGAGWRIGTAAFGALPAPLPSGTRAAHAPLALVLDGGSGSAQVTVTYTTPVPEGAVYLKHGPSRNGLGCTGATACAQAHWYALPGAVFSPDRTRVTFTLEDGGDGDSDGTANGRITDPGVPALLPPAPPPGARAIPALSAWALALLAALLVLLARRGQRQPR